MNYPKFTMVSFKRHSDNKTVYGFLLHSSEYDHNDEARVRFWGKVYADEESPEDAPIENDQGICHWAVQYISWNKLKILATDEIPWFVMPLNDEYPECIVVPGKGLRVGCQWFPIEQLDTLMEALRKPIQSPKIETHAEQN